MLWSLFLVSTTVELFVARYGDTEATLADVEKVRARAAHCRARFGAWECIMLSQRGVTDKREAQWVSKDKERCKKDSQ